MGEQGDTDHEELLPGIHKTLVLEGLVKHGSEKLLRDVESYTREDVVPVESPNIIFLAEGYGVSEMQTSIEKIGTR